MQLANYFRLWLDGRDLTPRTRELYLHLFARHLDRDLGAFSLSSITPDIVEHWHSARRRVVGGMQAAKAYRLLHAVLNTAVADELLLSSPCRSPANGREDSPERPLLTPAQVLALADAIDPRYRALVLVAGTGGLRLGELLGLRLVDVDLSAGTVQVEQAATHMMSGARLLGPPKSLAGRRVVTLPAFVVDALRRHLAARSRDSAVSHVFTTPAGQPLDKATLYRAWRAARAKVGLDHVTLHDLRHAAATFAAWAGASTRELMARIGHSSPWAALRYQHAVPERDHDIACRLDEIFTQARLELAKSG